MEAAGKGGKAARGRKAKKERSTGHNPEECPVCMIVYDDTVQRPHTLPCGHTVCTMCVNKLKQLGRVACPECRVSHAVPEGGQFPVNYIAEAFIRRMRDAEAAAAAASPPPSAGTRKGKAAAAGQKEAAGLSRKMRSFLQEQEASVVAAITACQEVQAQLDQYQTTLRVWGEQQQQLEDRLQGLLDQSRSARELVQQEESRASALKEEAREGEQQLHATLEALCILATEQEARVAIGEVLGCTFEAKEMLEECQGSFPDANTVTTVRKVREASNAALEAFQAALEAHPSVVEEEARPQSEAECSTEDRLQAILSQSLKITVLQDAGHGTDGRPATPPLPQELAKESKPVTHTLPRGFVFRRYKRTSFGSSAPAPVTPHASLDSPTDGILKDVAMQTQPTGGRPPQNCK